MTAEEYDSAFRFAAALWPAAFEPGAGGVQAAWAPSLRRYQHRTLCSAFEDLAKRHERFPPLSKVVEVCREVESLSGPQPLPRITSREPRPWHTQPIPERVAEFENSMRTDRARRRTEMAQYAEDYGMSQEWLTTRYAEIDRIGPHEAAALAKMRGEEATPV